MTHKTKAMWVYSEEDREQIIHLIEGLHQHESCEIVASRPLGFFLSHIQERIPGQFVCCSTTQGPRIWKYLIERHTSPGLTR